MKQRGHDKNCELSPAEHERALDAFAMDYEDAVCEVIRLRELAIGEMRKHFSVREIASAMGISGPTISRWETGDRDYRSI